MDITSGSERFRKLVQGPPRLAFHVIHVVRDVVDKEHSEGMFEDGDMTCIEQFPLPKNFEVISRSGLLSFHCSNKAHTEEVQPILSGLILLSVALHEREAFYCHVIVWKQKGKALSTTEMKKGR
jgi:hypothetical protein